MVRSATSSNLSDNRTTRNGYVKFGAAKLGGGVLRRDNEASLTPKSNRFFIGGTYAFTPAMVIDAEVMKLNVKNSPNEA